MQLRTNQRKGSVTVLVAVCMIVLVGAIALVLDGGVLRDDQRKTQGAADAAAMSAGEDLYRHYLGNQGLDPKGTAKAAALASANAAGFTNAQVQVNIPPAAGVYAGKAGYAEVIVTRTQPRFFSVIWGKGAFTVSARAVGQGRWVRVKNGIILLDPTSPGALTTTGGGTVTITGGASLIIDSNSPTAGTASGGGTAIASEFDITGAPGISGNGTFIGPIVNQPPTPDPLAYLPEPDPAKLGLTVQAHSQVHPSVPGTTYLFPGVYQGGIKATGGASLYLNPGIYIMQGGGFSFSGTGITSQLTAQGVMIVNQPTKSSDTISITGSGKVTVSPMTTGLYQGMSFWQSRSSSNIVIIAGNGSLTSVTGTFYAPQALLDVTGNGVNSVIGSQYISYQLRVNGNGSFNVNWDPNNVAPSRLVGLVE
jgi:hypothetical protein